VFFHGLSALSPSSGNVQVTAYGDNENHCKVAGWSGDVVSVRCFDGAGDPVDSVYSLLYLFPDTHAASHFAFALADQSASPAYAPPATHSYNAGGAGAITATRSGTGSYAMSWAGFSATGFNGGNVQVTAYGAGNARCRVNNWSSESAVVNCFDAAGNLADSAYSILYWRPEAGDRGLGFAWADDATSALYTPNSFFSYNAAGGAISVDRSGVGAYSIVWTGLGAIDFERGNVQVTAYGISNARCNVTLWVDEIASVRCRDGAGNPVDSRFSVLFVKPVRKPGLQDYAFALADQPAAALYTPDPLYSYNHLGGGIQISRASAGVYTVSFATFDGFTDGGNVQVTAYGSFGGAGKYCKVASWGGATVSVRCFDSSGAASDSYFTALFMKAAYSRPTGVAYAWANDSVAASYAPSGLYSYNPAGGAVTATRSGTGVYAMTWAGFSALVSGGGHAHATAYGPSNARCQIQGWSDDTVNVRCFAPAGSLVDSQYAVVYVRPDAVDDGTAFAWANEPGTSSYTPLAVYSFNAGGGAVTSDRFGAGNYRTTFAGFPLRGIGEGTVQVSGYGLSDTRCDVGGWGDDGDVYVTCRNSAGSLVDAQYNAWFIKPVAAPEPGRFAMFAIGAALLGLLARCRWGCRA
jgi:hypothetical protein